MYKYSFLDQIKNHIKYDSKFKPNFLKGGGSCNSSQIMCTDEEEMLIDINCTRHPHAKSISQILQKIDDSDRMFNEMSCKENYEIMTLEKFLLLFGKNIPINILSEYLANILCSLSTRLDKSKRTTKRSTSDIRLGRFGTIIDNPEVSDVYIEGKIEDHLKGKDINSSKYLIYLVVINQENYILPRDCTNKYYLQYPELSRILAFTVLDDKPCIPQKNYLSINIICSLSRMTHSIDQGKYKLVGKYLLLFIFAKAFQENFDKLILEVTNEIIPIDTIMYDDIEELDENNYFLNCPLKTNNCKINISRKDLEEGNTRFKCPCGVIVDYEYNSDDDECDEEESDDDQSDDDQSDDDECDEEESEEEDDDEESEEDSDEDESTDLIREINERDNDSYFNLYKYGGLLYKKGKLSTKGLYTKVYTRYGFTENPEINTKEYCFGLDALPSMEFNIPLSVVKKTLTWEKLIDVFLGKKKEFNIGKMELIEINLITIEKEIQIVEHILNKNIKDALEIFSILSIEDIKKWFKIEKIPFNKKNSRSNLFYKLYKSINN